MDRRLFEAAKRGDIMFLHQLIAENPLLLETLSFTSAENPLHITSIFGHVSFAKEILKLKPSFAQETNQDGFSPLHMASSNGHLEIVKEILRVDSKLCRLQGRNRLTSLHCAASRGRVEIVREILLACPESIENVTLLKETALHLSIKNSQFEAVDFMVKWVREADKDEILNMTDELGNSILHLATWRKDRQES